MKALQENPFTIIVEVAIGSPLLPGGSAGLTLE